MAKSCRVPSKLPKSRAARSRLLKRLVDCRAVVARAAITPAGDRRYKKLEGMLQRLHGNTLAGAPGWWPFGHKKAAPAPAPAKRSPMTRTVYMMKTKSGSYIPVDRPPNSVMGGARRKRRRR